MQLAELNAAGNGAIMNVSGGTHIWTQGIHAQEGGHLNIDGCTLHGNAIVATGSGSRVDMTKCTDAKNGTLSSCGGNPPSNTNGVPLCNNQNPLQACSVYTAN